MKSNHLCHPFGVYPYIHQTLQRPEERAKCGRFLYFVQGFTFFIMEKGVNIVFLS